MKNGRDLINLAKTRIGERYVFGAIAPKDAPDYHGPWDCAEFVSWTIYQVAGILYGCNRDSGNPATADAGTVYWGRDAEAKGKKISVDQAAGIPGAAVLRLAAGGTCGHIVFSDGKGGTVEAASTRLGVIASTLNGRRWSCGVLVPGIDYGQQLTFDSVKQPETLVYYLRSPFMQGEMVAKIQERLRVLGYLDTGQTDGIYGPLTATAVREFQMRHQLVADGEAGPVTLAALGVKP